jgi:hypothetical protein
MIEKVYYNPNCQINFLDIYFFRLLQGVALIPPKDEFAEDSSGNKNVCSGVALESLLDR